MRRICLDTNCLLMTLPSKSPYHKVWTDFLNGDIELCVSTEILLEYEEILSVHASPYLAHVVIETLTNKENLIRVEPNWHFQLIKADPDDNKFVDCAICGQAEYIVSNDGHFKVLHEIDFPAVTLLTLQQFIGEIANI